MWQPIANKLYSLHCWHYSAVYKKTIPNWWFSFRFSFHNLLNYIHNYKLCPSGPVMVEHHMYSEHTVPESPITSRHNWNFVLYSTVPFQFGRSSVHLATYSLQRLNYRSCQIPTQLRCLLDAMTVPVPDSGMQLTPLEQYQSGTGLQEMFRLSSLCWNAYFTPCCTTH